VFRAAFEIRSSVSKERLELRARTHNHEPDRYGGHNVVLSDTCTPSCSKEVNNVAARNTEARPSPPDQKAGNVSAIRPVAMPDHSRGDPHTRRNKHWSPDCGP
jgi:hypothetical protein